MKYYKGTKQECDAYNSEVTQGEGYQGTTTKWAEPVQIGNDYYIPKHPDYPEFEGLTPAELPEIEEPE